MDLGAARPSEGPAGPPLIFFFCPLCYNATCASHSHHSSASNKSQSAAVASCHSFTMDVALELLDPLVFDKAYAWALPRPSAAALSDSGLKVDSNSSLLIDAAEAQWPRDNVYRQMISILVVTQLGATLLYVFFSALSYYFIFDRRLEYHPRFLKNQVRQEIKSSLFAVPFINILTLPWFLAEVRGKSLLYADAGEYGYSWLLVSAILYVVFNDISIYWIHRLEHHPSVYKYIHKPHHKWIGESRSRQ